MRRASAPPPLGLARRPGLQSCSGHSSDPPVDVSDPAAVACLIRSTIERHGKIDAAVLAAAVRTLADRGDLRRRLAATDRGESRRRLLLHPRACTGDEAPTPRRDPGLYVWVVNIGWSGAAAYAASKAALIGLAKCAAQELRADGVRINVLSPGLILTPMFLESWAPKSARSTSARLRPLREDVVPTILHLISDATASLTGAVIQRRLVPNHK